MYVYGKWKHTHRYRKQTSGYQRREGSWEWHLGVCDLEVQTIGYKIDKQQGYTVQHREL